MLLAVIRTQSLKHLYEILVVHTIVKMHDKLHFDALFSLQ